MWCLLPSRFVWLGFPCLACGHQLVANGTMIRPEWSEAICVHCGQEWGFAGARHPDSESEASIMAYLTGSDAGI